MDSISILEDLFRYNSWAHHKIFSMCEGLSAAELDQPREMGFGSLRNTLFHNLAAEEIWYERWTNQPWRPFEVDACGISLSQIDLRLENIAQKRRLFLQSEFAKKSNPVCTYKDAKGNEFHNPLFDLALHVANHGIHHRAQALSFLKSFGRTLPGGLDYLFFRLAKPFVKQEDATATGLIQFGLEVATGSSPKLEWDAGLVFKYFQYGDWANAKLFDILKQLPSSVLDREIDLGLGSIRKSMLHLYDAESWWWNIWQKGRASFVHSAGDTSISDLWGKWSKLISERNSLIKGMTGEQADRIVVAEGFGPPLRFPVVESMVQLCGHGTHHRAQIINMLRQCSVPCPNLDYVILVREQSLAALT